jgi:hypothetical protein
VFRFSRGGVTHNVGLGAAGYAKGEVTLAAAWAKAAEHRRLLAEGLDPLQAKRAAQAKAVTFQQCAESHIDQNRAAWSPKHAELWAASLRRHVYPTLGAVAVEEVNVEQVLAVLGPLWQAKPITGKRVQNWIEAILDGARARGLHTG